MTTNQLAYWRMREDERRNRESEKHERLKITETERHNKQTEMYQLKDLGEKVRHNIVTEGQGADSLIINRGKLREDVRHNTAVELENQRSNMARETENHRSNVAREQIEWSRIGETKRHNLVLEPIEELKAYNNVTEAGLVNQILGRFFGDEDSPETPLARGARKIIDDVTKTGQKAIDVAKDYVDNRIRSINNAAQIVSGTIQRKVGEVKQAERVKDKELTFKPSTASTNSDRGSGRSFTPTGTKASSVSKAKTSIAKKKGERI